MIMKKIVVILAYLCIVSMFIACKGDDPTPLTEEQQTLKQLARTWSLNSASVDGTEVADWFNGLKLSFKESKSFTVENAVPPIWIASGSFELVKNGSTYTIKRNDGVDLTITSLSDSSVTITMNYQAPPSARMAGISGSFTFSFEAD